MSPERLWSISRRLHLRGFRRSAGAIKLVNYFLYRCLLPVEAEVGDGLRLRHHALGLVIHPNVTIGSGVTIYHGVTIAGETWIGSPHRVVIEDNVKIGAGAIIVPREHAGLRIGRAACVGAGAVVTRDVLPGDVVVGAPARSLARPTQNPAT